MKRAVLIFFATLLGLALTLPEGWSMGRRPPRPEEGKASTEVTSASPEKVAPLTLEDCYELALKRSETVAIRKEDIEEAKAQFFKATSEALGDIDFVITDFRQDAPKPRGEVGGGSSSFGSTFNARDRRERKFVISQPLFQGFKSLGALRGAGSFRKQRTDEWVRAKQLLFLDVASAFFALLAEKKELENIEGIQALLKEQITELKKREAIGRSRTSEVVQAEVKVKRAEGEHARVRGLLEASRHLLEFLVGIPVEPRQLEDEELPEGKAQELAVYLEGSEDRPDVEAARQAVKTAWGGVIVAQSGLWPEISLEHNEYVKREGFQSGYDWDLLLKMNVPLFRGGETLGKIKESRARWKKAKLAYELARREADLEIKEAYESWVASLERSNALEGARRASQENYRLQKKEYERNLISNLDLLDTLQELFETGRAANAAFYETKESYWRLRVARGDVV